MADRTPIAGLQGLDVLASLPKPDQDALGGAFSRRVIRRGELLVEQGEYATTLYVVVSGRFTVTVAGRAAPVAEIGPGQPVGEVAFLTGGRRTATVRALRDGVVLALERQTFENLAEQRPEIWRAMAETLARRLGTTNAERGEVTRTTIPRTIAVIPAGGSALPDGFVNRLERAIERRRRVRLLRRTDFEGLLGRDLRENDIDATERLNALEAEGQTLLLIADDQDAAFAEKVICHADLVLAVGNAGADVEPSQQERLAERFIAPHARRLVLVHPDRTRPRGTARWLAAREVAMHHHVCLSDDEDVERLVRFIDGRAKGLVACGGGALCCTHIGIQAALAEAGITFDIMGGTSAGSAITAAFALGWEAEAIDAAVHDIFVTNSAMKRYAIPRYALLDHGHFDRQLARYFEGVDIEDLWRPFFAVSSNLATNRVHAHTRGDLWRAIRASSSIPVLLPPVYSDDGHMLVDGAVLDNVPLKVMQELKTGPNAIVNFDLGAPTTYDVDYNALPSGPRLALDLALPWRRKSLPKAPSVGEVLLRSIMTNRQEFYRHVQVEDVVLVPPIQSGVALLDWSRHTEIMTTAYEWARAEAESLVAARHPIVGEPEPLVIHERNEPDSSEVIC